MLERRTIAIVLVTLVVGFIAGFVLRPLVDPAGPGMAIAGSEAVAAPRGVQYFAAHLDEAHAIVARCRDGSVRGDECANADQAVVAADSRDRAAKFMGKRPG